jgi:hypothetical protein
MLSEREFLTKRRLTQLDANPRLGKLEQWQKYGYMPFDIPRIENSKLVKWFFEEAQPVVKKNPDFSTPAVGLSSYHSVDVFPNGYDDGNIARAAWSLNIHQEFMSLFADVYKEIMDGFPFTKLNKISLWNSQQAIGWHRDDAKFIDCPNEFRVLLHDENPSSTVKVAKALPDVEVDTTTFYRAPKLTDTNSFAWNNLRTKHSTDFESEHRKIVMIFGRVEIDVDRYHDLMERSKAKYGDVAFVLDNPTSDWINL